MAMKRLFTFPKAPWLEPCYQIVWCHIQTLGVEGLTLLERRSRCIQQPQSTGLISVCSYLSIYLSSVCWDYWIRRLFLCRWVGPPPNECLEYDTKALGNVNYLFMAVTLKFTPTGSVSDETPSLSNSGGIGVIPSLSLLPDPHLLGQPIGSSGLSVRRETGVQSQVLLYQRIFQMVLDTTLLNTQHFKVWIRDKVEQSKQKRSALPYSLV